MESIKDMLYKNNGLALKIAYDKREVRDIDYTKSESNLIWAYADGLTEKYVIKMINGECSLADSISFNLSEFETILKSDFDMLSNIVTKYNIVLT